MKCSLEKKVIPKVTEYLSGSHPRPLCLGTPEIWEKEKVLLGYVDHFLDRSPVLQCDAI